MLAFMISGLLLTAFVMLLGGIYLRFLVRRILPMRKRARGVRELTELLSGTGGITSVVNLIPDWMRSPFDEFVEQCWQIGDTWYNHEQSSRYVHTAALMPVGAAAYQTTPATLTGLGILGTFIGIVVGLVSLAAPGGISEDAIQQLISGLLVSFITSILGLTLSLVATAQNSNASTQLDETVNGLQDAMDGLVERAVSPRILASMLEQQRLHLEHLRDTAEQEVDRAQQEADHFTKLADYVAKPGYLAPEQQDARAQRLLEAIDQSTEQLKGPLDSLQHSMHEAMEQAIQDSGLVTALQDMAATLARHQQEGAAELLQTFNDNLASNFGESFGQLGTSIEQMVQANSQYEVAMGQTTAQLQAGSQAQSEAAAQMQSAATTVQGTVGQLDQAAASIQAAAAATGAMMAEHREALEQQRSVTTDVVQAVSAQTANWEAHQRAILQAHDGLQERFDGLGNAVEQLVRWHDAVRQELADQVVAWSAAVDAQQAITSSVASERRHWQGLVDELRQATEGLQSVGQGLQGIMKGLDAAGQAMAQRIGDVQTTHQQGAADVARVASELHSLQGAMGSSFEDYAQVVGQLSAALPDVTALLDGLTATVASQSQLVKQTDALAAGFRELSTDQAKLHEELGQMVEVTRSTKEAMSPTADALASSATGLTSAADTLAATQGQLKDMGAALETVAQQLSERDRTAAQQWQSVQAAMVSTTEQLTTGADRYHEGVNTAVDRTFRDFDNGLAKAVKDMQSATGALHEIVQDMMALADPVGDAK